MAAPAWVSATAQSSGASATSATVNLPTTAANDILIVTAVNGGANAALTTTTGTYNGSALAVIGSGGWTTGWGATYWTRCTGDHSGQTVIITGATNSCALLVQRFSGCTTSGNPYDTNISDASVAAGANCALAAFNTTVADTLVVYSIAVDDNQNTSAMTKGGAAMGNLSIASSTGGTDSHCASASLAQAATGTTGAFAATLAAGTNEGKRATAFALVPAANPQTINAGVASEADAALAATIVQPQAPVSGGVASEADSGPAATVSQPQAPVAGGVASEADSAPAATVDQAGGAFSPDDIAGLEVWLDADAIGGADGDPVTTWANLGSGADATSSTGQTLQTNEQNGLPGVLFDGTDDFFSLALAADASRTFFVVARQSSLVGRAVWGLTSSVNGGVGTNGSGAYLWASPATGLGGLSTTASIVTARLNSATSLDGYVDSGSATNLDPANQVTTETTFQIGARASSSFWNGYVFEFLVYDSALSDTDLDDVRTYLTEKWLNAPQTISGGVASEADSAPVATVSQPQAPVSGGVASEADSANAATVVQPQAPVAAGTAQESDSANAATVVQPQAPVAAGTASEADSAPAATVNQGDQQIVSGGVASETDTATAASVIQPQAPVSGGVASETDSVPPGTVSQPQAPVSGGVASEADSAPAATVDQAAGDQTILAGVASEVDSVPAATPTGGAQPPDTNPELGGVVSEPTLGGVFDESVTGGTFAEPSHGGNVTEPTLNGVFDETTTGGDVTEPDEGAEIDNLLGGGIDEVLTNGSVTEPSINGNVTEPALNGNVTEPDLGALLDEAVRSSEIDEATRSGTPDEPNRGGMIDEVLTGGEIF
jgi:hypothetical protein